MRGLCIVIALTACGRFGFDSQPPQDQPDATPQGDAGPQPALAIPCNQPGRFAIGATTLDGLAATPTATGFAIATLVGTNLFGYAYEWNAAAQLAMTGTQVAISDTTSTFGIAASDTDVVVAAVVGTPSPTSTAILPRATDMSMRASTKMHGDIGGMVPIANSGVSAHFAFISTATNGDVVATPVDASGDYAGAAVTIVTAAKAGNSATIAPAGSGYLMTWLASAASPNELDIALLDDTLAVVAGPVVVNTVATGFDPIRPHAAWAPTSDTYVVAWHEKDVPGDDNVWVATFDKQLAPIVPAKQIVTKSYDAAISTDGTDFFLGWNNYTSGTNRLEAVQLSAAGTQTPIAVTSTGGQPKKWAIVSRTQQAVLVWAEINGTGPDLWIQAMCP